MRGIPINATPWYGWEEIYFYIHTTREGEDYEWE
jgi:hypothetical protein